MNYQQTLDYFYAQLPMFHRIGAAAYKANLCNTIAICRLLKHPERNFRSIHVAGTNGKGSTSHMLASVMMETGLKTGLFTSPHLRDFRERITINGKKIPRSVVSRFVTIHKKAFDDIKPSFFEITFALAAWWFSEEKVDIAVMETGMGGRLDSTNVITPELSIITNIGFDHTQFLGDSLEAIAGEKAGIIKPGVPVVIGETQAETIPVFRQFAKKAKTTLFQADQNFRIASSFYTHHRVPLLRAGILENGKTSPFYLTSPLAATYQLKNLVTVVQAAEVLRQKHFMITDEHLRQGIRNVVRNTGLMGRWQTISLHPLTIADIGHNAAGISALAGQIATIQYNHLHFVLGVVNDKDVTAMLKLLPNDATYYFCKADIPRGLDAVLLAEKAHKTGLRGTTYTSVKHALETAQKAATEKDLVFIGGSAFVVAEIV
jgi:dihydrofolate synthase / folylpolyglutamate synthase